MAWFVAEIAVETASLIFVCCIEHIFITKNLDMTFINCYYYCYCYCYCYYYYYYYYYYYNHFMALCPGPPGQLVPEETFTHSPILITNLPLSASSIYYDP